MARASIFIDIYNSFIDINKDGRRRHIFDINNSFIDINKSFIDINKWIRNINKWIRYINKLIRDINKCGIGVHLYWYQ